MSLREQSHRFDQWQLDRGDDRETASRPADCDCGDTIRELLAESAGTAAACALIIALVRALG